MLEERRNPTLRKTLEVVGSEAHRAAHEGFHGILIHAFEKRTGASLMEWLARELSLVDLAIAVDGLPIEVGRWIANLDHRALQRVFISYRPERLTQAQISEMELDRYDQIFASSRPAADVSWQPIHKAIAPQDMQAVPPEYLPDDFDADAGTPEEAAKLLEAFVAQHTGEASG